MESLVFLKLRKTMFAMMMCLFALLSTFPVLNIVKANPGWLSGWTYRKSHEFGNATGADTNYQMKIVVVNGSDTDSGNTVYVDDKMENDFGDVRFTDNDETTELDYWMEELHSGENATFWVEVSDDLSSSNATIYMYYGKSGASTTSDGDASFTFFDHFLGSSLNQTKWDEIESPSITVSDSVIRVYYSSDTDAERGIMTDTTYGAYGLAVMGLVKYSDTGMRTWFGMANRWDSDEDQMIFLHWASASDQYCNNKNDGTSTQTAITAAVGSYVTDEIKWKSGECKYIRDGSTVETHTTNIPNEALKISFGLRSFTTSNEIHCDWVAVRKYVDPEPTHGSWGSEESTDDTAPLYQNVDSNDTSIDTHETILLYGQGYDETGLDWAWLATNETETWKNYTTYDDIASGFTFIDRFESNAKQGITLSDDGTYVYCTADSNLSKYDRDGTLLETRDTTSDGSYGDHLGDACYYNNKVYIATCNWPTTPHASAIAEHAASDLNYITEHAIAWTSDYASGVSYHNDYFWVIYNSGGRIEKYNLSWSLLANYALTYTITGTNQYQGCDWIGNYLYCNIHSAATPLKCDVYYWTGSTFTEETRLDRPTSTCTQGLACDPKDDEVMWWAERNYPSVGIQQALNSTINGIVGRFYDSPIDCSNIAETWTWSNFTWQNTSLITDCNIEWKIYYNDTSGNENVTATLNFNITVIFENLNLRTIDVDSNVLSDATVTMNNGTDYSSAVDSNGWVNFTGLNVASVTVTVNFHNIEVNSTTVTTTSDATVDLNCTTYPYVLSGTRYWAASNATISTTSWSSSTKKFDVTFSSVTDGDVLDVSGSRPTYILGANFDLSTDYTSFLELKLDTNSFGKTDVGSTTTVIPMYITGSWYTCPVAATPGAIEVYLSNWGAGAKVKCAIHKRSDLSLVAETEERTTGGAAAWYTFQFSSSPSLVEGTDYYLSTWSDSNTIQMRSTTGESDKGTHYYLLYTGPFRMLDEVPVHESFSIYCTFSYDVTLDYESWSGLYVEETDQTLTSLSWAGENLYITTTGEAGDIGTIEVYCGTRGQPSDDYSFATTSYSSSPKIFTGTYTFSSSVTLCLVWSGIAGVPSGPSGPIPGIFTASASITFASPIQAGNTVNGTIMLEWQGSNSIYIYKVTFSQNMSWFHVTEALPLKIIKEAGTATGHFLLFVDVTVPEDAAAGTYDIPCEITIRNEAYKDMALGAVCKFDVSGATYKVPEYMTLMMLAFVGLLIIGAAVRGNNSRKRK